MTRTSPRRLTALAVALVSVALSVFAFATPAQAWPYQNPVVKWAGHARFAGGHAWVRAVYRCYGGNQNTHIWVSLKQGPKISAMTLKQLNKAEGTSQLARSWYDTNKTDPQKVYIICDGTWQHQTFKLTREKGTLHRGHAYLQFCLFDSHAGPPGPGVTKGFAAKYAKPYIRHR